MWELGDELWRVLGGEHWRVLGGEHGRVLGGEPSSQDQERESPAAETGGRRQSLEWDPGVREWKPWVPSEWLVGVVLFGAGLVTRALAVLLVRETFAPSIPLPGMWSLLHFLGCGQARCALAPPGRAPLPAPSTRAPH